MAEGNIGGTPISELPASSFAYCEPGMEAVSTRCHFPIRDAKGKPDAAHVRNALARLSGSPFEAKARPKVEAAAKELGIGAPAKSYVEMKATPFSSKQHEQWLNGEISRRILPLPFYGPIPDPKGLVKGYDLDDEFFDATTDLYGPFAGLRASRWREIDWHHDDLGVPAKRVGGPASMKGALIGEMEMDADPDEDGLWADWWIKRGQARRDLVARRIAEIERRGEPLYNSTQAIYKQKASNGHIEVWPVYRNTVTTAPQNAWAAVPPLKAMLDDLTTSDLSGDALGALLVGLDAIGSDLAATSTGPYVLDSGDPSAKSGRVLSTRNETAIRTRLRELRDAVAAFEAFVDETVQIASEEDPDA